MGEVGIPAIKLSPASLQHLLLGEREGDGMQTRESGRLGVLEYFWGKEILCLGRIRMRNRYGLAGGIGIGGKEMKWNDGKYGSDGGFRKRWEAAEKGEWERKRILLGWELDRVGNGNGVRMDRWIYR